MKVSSLLKVVTISLKKEFEIIKEVVSPLLGHMLMPEVLILF